MNKPPISSVSGENYEAKKERLMGLLAAIQNARDAKVRSGLLNSRENEELSLGITVLKDAVEKYIACSGLMLQRIGNTDAVYIADMLGYCGTILASGGMVLRHVGLPTASDHRVVNKLRSKPSHVGKTNAMEARAERARSIIESAERKRGEGRKFAHPRDVLEQVSKLLKMPQLDLKTLNAYRTFIDQKRRNDSSPGLNEEQ